MTTVTELPPTALPEGALQAQRPNASHITALGIRDAAGKILAYAGLRQRRTAEVIHVIAWSAPEPLAADLAAGVEAFARARQADLLRAIPEQAAAIAALGLEDSGRGYAERWLSDPIPLAHPVAKYNQSTDYTCGPVSLSMAMGQITRSQEFEIWREATTMVGLTGPGGCGPYGMSLAAVKRGFRVELHFDSDGPVMLDRANTPGKRDISTFVQTEFRQRAEAEPAIEIHADRLPAEAMVSAVAEGAMVILLIDQCHTHDHHAPHWILLHAVRADGTFLVNDPWVEPPDQETGADVDCLPMKAETLYKMGAYGDPAYHAALILRPA